MEELREMVSQLLRDRFSVVASSTVAAVSALLVYLYSRRKPEIEFKIPLDQQSVEIQPGVRTSKLAPDGKLIEYFFEDARTTHEAFLRGLRVSENGRMLGTKTGNGYVWKSYQTVYDEAQALGSALLDLGVTAGEDGIVGLYAANRQEWVVTSEALSMFSMVVVPLYDTLGKEACSFIINQTSITVVVCDTNDKVSQMLEHAAETPSLKYIIVMDKVSNNNLDTAHKSEIEIIGYADMLSRGKNVMRPTMPPKPEDLSTICYTSGTTGNPKGVMLTHGAFISNTAAIAAQVPAMLGPDDCYISYLPLPHMFERASQLFLIQHGASIGFFGGDVRKLIDDIQVLRPTVFNTVPRLLNRIYDRVMMGVQGSMFKSYLFNMALRRKTAMLERGVMTNSSIWDKLVFSKVQKMLGGRIKFVAVGSAPLATSVLNFTRCAFGCYIMEGYGQTECVAGCALTLPNDYSLGHVGPPIACNLFKLVDVPEMDYYAKDGKGELCIKGLNTMRGYYKDPEKTKETLDEDGWVHTGDVGQWMPNGAMKIIDRRKHIFKLSQGEYLAPEKIENIYTRSPFVAQVFVDGDSLQTFAVAIAVLDEEYMQTWAKKKDITGTMEEMCRNEFVIKTVHNDLTKQGKEAGLKGFEQAKVIHLHAEMFSVENGLLTPTFKSKRPALRKHFANEVAQMYAEN